MLAISIVLVATGISLYVDAALVNMPMEGLVSAIVAKQNKYAFHQIKVIVDCIVVLLAAILSLAALHDLQGVREGTLLCALLVGKIMPLIREKLLCRFK